MWCSVNTESHKGNSVKTKYLGVVTEVDSERALLHIHSCVYIECTSRTLTTSDISSIDICLYLFCSLCVTWDTKKQSPHSWILCIWSDYRLSTKLFQ